MAALKDHVVDSRPHRWRVLEGGAGAPILLIHGAGASADSWRGVMERLADHRHVLAPDLPGHGATRLGTRLRSGLNPMAEDLSRLMETMDVRPSLIVGHSAGAAIALRMSETSCPDTPLVCFNAALAQFPGLAGVLFPTLAHFLSLSPGAGELIAMAAASWASTAKLLASTGGAIDDEMVDRYHRLITHGGHVKGALNMMAQWRVQPIRRALPGLTAPVRLIVGGEDGTVPPAVSREAAGLLPESELVERADLGHLAHEQDPAWAAEEILRDFQKAA